MLDLDYGKTYSGLNWWGACIVFFKKNGELRVMLASRSRAIAAIAGCGDKITSLNYRDAKCNINNGTIGVIDLVLGEARAFNTKRVAWFEWVNIRNQQEFDQAILRVKQLEEQYKVKLVNMGTLDGMDEGLGAPEDTEGKAPSEPGSASGLEQIPGGEAM